VYTPVSSHDLDVSLFHGHRELGDDTLTPIEVNTMATTYDTAFTAQGVPWVTVRKKPMAKVARDLGIPDTTRRPKPRERAAWPIFGKQWKSGWYEKDVGEGKLTAKPRVAAHNSGDHVAS
jgi:hypothetical protein